MNLKECVTSDIAEAAEGVLMSRGYDNHAYDGEVWDETIKELSSQVFEAIEGYL
nr:hypothetical protein [Rhodococcus sp. (in: high G+C Gram-positive bacteria)]